MDYAACDGHLEIVKYLHSINKDCTTKAMDWAAKNDYLEIASTFHTVILSDVPKMVPRMSSEARRFTWLIDVFYDHKIKLIISAEVEPDLLYVEGQMSGEFHRTVSRIIEMQSKEYLHAPRRVIDTSLT